MPAIDEHGLALRAFQAPRQPRRWQLAALPCPGSIGTARRQQATCLRNPCYDKISIWIELSLQQ